METTVGKTALLVTLDHHGSRVLAYAVQVEKGRIRYGQGRMARQQELAEAGFEPHSGIRKLDEVNLLTDAVPLDTQPAEGFATLDVAVEGIPDRPVKLSLYTIEKGQGAVVEEFASGANYELPHKLKFAEVLASRHIADVDPEILVVVWTLTDDSWESLQKAR